jgi:hypothetical protein
MAASESEFSMSSSSKSPSAAPSGFCSPPSSSSLAALNGVGADGRRRRSRRLRQHRRSGDRHARHRHHRLAVGADHRDWHRLGVRSRIGRLEVDDVAQENLSLVELVAPDDDGLEGERALAQPGDHRLAAGLDALGDGDLAFAREQLARAHLAQIHAHRVVGALARFLGLGFGRDLLPDLDHLAALGLGLFLWLVSLRLLARLLGLDHVDAHLAEHGEHVLELLGADLFRQRVDLVMGDAAALLGGANELLDRRVGKVEQRAVRRSLETLVLRHLILLRRRPGLACHRPLQPALSSLRIVVRRSRTLKGALRLLKTSSALEAPRFSGEMRPESPGGVVSACEHTPFVRLSRHSSKELRHCDVWA